MAQSQTPYECDKDGTYVFKDRVSEESIVEIALSIVARRVSSGEVFSSPEETRRFLTLKLAPLEHEVFCSLFLDNRHKLIVFEQLFTGTIDGTSVHPREVVKRALKLNAAAIIFAHNHPSGIAEPSAADQAITRRLQEALSLVDVRVLDHFVVGGAETVSFAERGLL